MNRFSIIGRIISYIVGLEWHSIIIILLNKLGEICYYKKTKIMLYLPTELTPNYIVRWIKAQIYTVRTKAPNFAWL